MNEKERPFHSLTINPPLLGPHAPHMSTLARPFYIFTIVLEMLEQGGIPQISFAFQDFWQILRKEGRLNWI